MNERFYLALLTCFVALHLQAQQVTPHVISFFVRPLPSAPAQALSRALESSPKRIPLAKKQLPTSGASLSAPFKQAGLYSSYAGTLTYSSDDGHILLERISPQPELTIVVSNSIKPVPIDPFKQKTITGFIVPEEAAAQAYHVTRVQDPETELYVWQIEETELDRSSPLPYDTLVLHAEPDDIVLPVGATPTQKGENFILPDVYLTKGYNAAHEALRVLKIRHYFAPPRFDSSFLPLELQKKLRPE